jgi:hypothetical protein
MARVEFEPTIPVFVRSKTVRALDATITVLKHKFKNIFRYMDSQIRFTVDADDGFLHQIFR